MKIKINKDLRDEYGNPHNAGATIEVPVTAFWVRRIADGSVEAVLNEPPAVRISPSKG